MNRDGTNRDGSDGPRPELDGETIRELEASIFAARNFVVPSTDLRPRTLEQAKDARRTHMWANHLTVGLLAAMFFWGLAVTAVRQLGEHRNKLAGPFPHDIEQRAQSYSQDHPYATQWRTLDAFQQERGIPPRSRDGRSQSVVEPGAAKLSFQTKD